MRRSERGVAGGGEARAELSAEAEPMRGEIEHMRESERELELHVIGQ